MSPQTINTKPRLNSDIACKVGAKEVNVMTPLVEGAEAIAVVHVVADWFNKDGPLDESPTRNVLPPIGGLRPTVVSNWLRLKSVRLGETSIFCFGKSAG